MTQNTNILRAVGGAALIGWYMRTNQQLFKSDETN